MCVFTKNLKLTFSYIPSIPQEGFLEGYCGMYSTTYSKLHPQNTHHRLYKQTCSHLLSRPDFSLASTYISIRTIIDDIEANFSRQMMDGFSRLSLIFPFSLHAFGSRIWAGSFSGGVVASEARWHGQGWGGGRGGRRSRRVACCVFLLLIFAL